MADIQKIIGETSTFTIALIVIVGFLVFFAHTLLYSNLETLEKVTTLLSPFVAAIIGYFFGQRPAQASARQAEDATRQREEAVRESESATDIILREKRLAEEALAKIKHQMEQLNRVMGLE